MIELQNGQVVLVQSFLSVTTGILVLFSGKARNQRIAALREYNIPEPVTGGLVFAVAFLFVYFATGYRITFELSVRDLLLVYFFVTIGLNARVADLKAGGRPLVILLLGVTGFLLLQNAVGVATASLLDLPPELGVLAGSVSMLGGHGTAIAWAPAFAAGGVANALEIGVLCATAGLVMSSLAGGPLAHPKRLARDRRQRCGSRVRPQTRPREASAQHRNRDVTVHVPALGCRYKLCCLPGHTSAVTCFSEGSPHVPHAFSGALRHIGGRGIRS